MLTSHTSIGNQWVALSQNPCGTLQKSAEIGVVVAWVERSRGAQISEMTCNYVLLSALNRPNEGEGTDQTMNYLF